ncbi:MAG: DUF58 domain-containing protein [Nitrospirae bacterium]|nr:MAG: DUF58 domain-containing protein [Nitrospirota bacterium]
MPDAGSGFREATRLRIEPQWPMIVLFSATLFFALACLTNLENAVAMMGLIDAVLILSWFVAATAITHLCGGHKLALKPPQMHADFHQLSGFRVEVRLGNRSRRLPALGVMLRLDVQTEGVPLISPPVHVNALPPRSTASCAWDIAVRKRGEVEVRGARAKLSFPGSLFAHECHFTFAHRKLALPAVFRLDNRALDLLSGRRKAESRSAVIPASSGDFIGVRHYRQGDNPRDVHLALSVRLPDFPFQLAIREFEDPASNDVCVVLDTAIPPDSPDLDTLRHNHEVSLSFAVAFCRLLVDRRYRVRFCAVDGRGGRIDLNILRPSTDLPELEARLARVHPVEEAQAVTRLISDVYSRASASVFLVGLRDGMRPLHGVFSIAPGMQRRLVREVVGA